MSIGTSLYEQQYWFLTASTHAAGVNRGAEIGALGLGRPLLIEHMLTDGPNLPAASRFQIYNDGYFARLIECLADDYPALAHLLGADEFETLARAYIEKHPSRSPSLNAYGAHMSSFVRARSKPWASFAADLARLEWALAEVVHAPSTASLGPAALAAIPPARLRTARLTRSPTLRVLSFDYPVNRYFQAFCDDEASERPERRTSTTAIYRRDLTIWRMDLEPAAAMLLEDLVAGAPLDSAIAELERRTKDAEDLATRLPRWLGAWVSNGFFSAIEA